MMKKEKTMSLNSQKYQQMANAIRFLSAEAIEKAKKDLSDLIADCFKILKDNNYHNNKSVIINEERVLNKIKNKYFIDIFSYINTSQSKLNLKLIFNTDEKSIINKKVNSNQIKNKILLQAFLPKKLFEKNDNQIPNPYIIHNSENEEEEEDDNDKEEENSEKNDNNNNLLNNIDYVPISLKKFFLEKYKVSELGRYSKINIDIKNDLNKRKNKKNIKSKKFIPKNLVIKVDNHNEKMIHNYLNKLKAKKDKTKEKNNSNNKANKNNNKTQQNENDEIINKKEEKRIINLFGLNIAIKKGKTPLQHLKDYMAKKGINSSKELEEQIKLKNNLSKLIAKLQLFKKKKRRKGKIKSIKNFSKLLDINYNTDNLVKLANNGINPDLTTSKKLKYFDTSLIKSRKDAEKRKMQLLLKFKNDMEYKAMKGDIDETELNMYSKLEEKIDKLMDLINLNEYVAKMEDYIGEFQEEINLREKSRNDEKRINGFIEKLHDDFNHKTKKKNYMINRYGKVINFNCINHINDLNNI